MQSHEQHLDREDPRKRGRRDFLLGLGRIAILGGVIVAGYVIKKPRNGDFESERCPNGRLCRNCAILARCNLPAAETARQAAERE